MKELSEIPAVSGNEGMLRRFILSLIEDKCDSLTVDSMGNIIALKKGRSDKKKILIGTHMDESGFILSKITDTGFLKFKPVGKIEPRCIVSKPVVIGNKNIKGVIGMKAIHLQKKEEREAAVKTDDLYIDIGAQTKDEAEKLVSLGDYITFDTKFGKLGNNIKGKALKRFGCLCLIKAMDEKPAYDTWFIFSTQREIPCSVPGRGMRIAAHSLQPDYALIIDAFESDDLYKNDNRKISLNNGAVIVHKDKTTISDSYFARKLKEYALNNNIKVQETVSFSATSSAVAVQTASAGAKVVTVSLPGKYLNTPVSVMNENDINAVSDLCSAFVKESDVILNGIA
jgi:endoglucanase